MSLLRCLPLALLLLSLSVQPALAQLNPFSAIATAVETAAEDRKAGDITADLKLKAAIVSALADQMGKLAVSVSVDVYEQDVLLTGKFDAQADKDKAGKVAQGVQGVKKVINEIRLAKATAPEKGAVENFADDTVIEKKINALFLEAKGMNTANWRWHAVGGHVVLFGRALSKEESQQAEKIVKGIKDVVSVTNRAKIKPKS
jgi:hyperosmotically inducible protein